MDFATITVADLAAIAKLIETKEALLAKVAGINAQLTALSSGQPAAPVAARRGRKPGKVARIASVPKAGRKPRGQMKEAIIGLLKEAGKDGLSVRDIATTLKVNPANVHVWFGSTGKKIKEIKKNNGKRMWVG